MIHYARKLAPSTARATLECSTINARLASTPFEFVAPMTGGYSTIICEVGTPEGSRAVLRWRPHDAHTLLTEIAAAAHARAKVNVPEILSLDEDCALMSWVEGVRVDTLLEDDTSRSQWPLITRACGASLAALHTLRFDTSGFFTPQMSIGQQLGGSGSGLARAMTAWLGEQPVRRHLGPRQTACLLAMIEAHATSWRELDEDGPRLVHSDFNTKNLIARRDEDAWHITILDWEYAFAGSRFIDLGNFLRFEHERPEAARAFIEGYNAASPTPLPDTWRDYAYLCDLCSMLSMLTRDDLSSRTRATVTRVIDHILHKVSAHDGTQRVRNM